MAMLYNSLCTLLSFAVTYGLALSVYRLYFHPLRRFPGPKITAITKWYEFYYDVLRWPGGNFASRIDRMHDVFGPIVRINPNEIHIRDSEWLETLYVSPSRGVRDKYAPAAYMTGTPLGVFGTVNHEVHHRRKAAVSNFFSKRAVRNTEQTIYQRAEKAIQVVRSDIERLGFSNLRCTFLAFATDVLTEHCFESDLRLLDDRDASGEWLATIKAIAFLTPLVKQFTWIIPAARSLPVIIFDLMYPPLARILHLFQRMRFEALAAIKLRASLDTKTSSAGGAAVDIRHHNVFQAILSSSLPSREKRRERMAQEGFVFIAAGGETVSRILTNCTFYILSKPDTVLQRVKSELNSILTTHDARPSIQQLESLPYFSATIKESLRVTALVTSRLPVVAPTETLRYGSWAIPAGSPVSMTYRDVLLDPKIFKNPLEFQPERWLEPDGDAERMSQFFVPFGRGGRMCPAMNLATAELHIMMAMLFHQLDLKLHDTSYDRDVKIVRDCFVGEVATNSMGVRVALL